MANHQLLDIMNGKIKDTNQIAGVLANASDAEFVDVLNYLDGNVLSELMTKLPESRRNLIADFAKVDNMCRRIHTKNEVFDVSAEEYIKNSENLDKWNVNLKDKDFAQAREVAGWMNVSDEAKQLLMDTAVLKVKEESRNVKNLTEKQYKEAINFEIQLAVYQATVATSAVKQDKNPKIATQEAVNQFVEAGRKQATKGKKSNFLDVSVDSILAYSAKTSEWVANRANQAKKEFADTKQGSKIAKIVDAINKKLEAKDKYLSSHKTWGKTYKFMKKYAPALGEGARSMAVNLGMLSIAAATGPAGMALYAAYAVSSSCEPLIKEYKKEKKNNQNLNFAAFVADNKMLTLKGVVGATTMIVAGTMGYGAFGVSAMKARLGISAASGAINSGVIYQQDRKAAAVARAAGQENVKEASVWRAVKRGFGNAAIGFGMGWLLGGNSSGETATETDSKNTLMMPDEYKAQLESAQADSLKHSEVVTEPVTPVATEKAEVDAKLKGALELVDDSCCEEQPAPSKVVNANDCETKIAIQENAPETDADKQFWGDRANKFVKPCDQNAIAALFKLGVFNLDEMPGIGSEVEFTYKFGIMREMNLPHQRGLVEMIEEKINVIQEIGCNDGLSEQQKLDALSKITSYGKDGGEAIADGMNSYDNRGNYLCEEPKPVKTRVVEAVEEPKVEEKPIEQPITVREEKVPPLEPVAEPVVETPIVEVSEQRTISVMDVNVGKDYRNADVYILNGQMSNETLEEIKFINREFTELAFENGDNIVYNFKGDDLVVATSTLTVDETTRNIAAKIDGLVVEQYNGEMADATNAALSINARLEIYNDLLENGELKGQKAKWGERFMHELNSYGFTYDAEQRNLAPIEGFDREAAMAEAQAEAEKIKAIKNGEIDTKGKNKDGVGFFGRGRDDVYR